MGPVSNYQGSRIGFALTMLVSTFILGCKLSLALNVDSTSTTTAATTASTTTNPTCEYQTVFIDHFNSLDLSNWNIVSREKNHNEELQFYTDRKENVRVEGGMLVITPREENYGEKKWTSGRVTGKNKRSFKYGRFTVRAKLPSGLGLWSAIWMMPQDAVYGEWAASGEIDIMEADGSRPGLVSSALHFGNEWPNNRYEGVPLANPFDGTCPIREHDLSADFHDYQLVWTPTKMVFLVDDEVTWEVDLQRDWHLDPNTKSPYDAFGQPWDQRFYFILNCAVGGWFLQDPVEGSGEDWPDAQMLVDFVQVEQRDGDDDGLCGVCKPYKRPSPDTLACRVKAGLTEADVSGPLQWVCGDENVYVDVDCDAIFASHGVSDDDVVTKATLAFDAYYKNGGRTDTACCFGDPDGKSNCVAEVVCDSGGDDGTSPTTGAPTASPTASPISMPTTSPTTTLTATPISISTSTPTSSVHSSPTSAPTTSPISAPTTSPTSAPTTSPTSAPTTSPTSTHTTSPTSAPTTSPTSMPTTSPTISTITPTATPISNPTPLCPTCKLKEGATDFSPALNWVCNQDIFRLSCPDLFPPGNSEKENANIAFNHYYLGVVDKQGDQGCCFGDSDGFSNCRTEVVAAPCSASQPSPDPPQPSPHPPFPSNPNDLFVTADSAVTLEASPVPYSFNVIIVSGTLTIDSNTHVRARRIEVLPEGTLVIGPDATGVLIELLHDDCRGPSAPHPDDAVAVATSTCLRSGQIVSRGTTRIEASPVTSWTLMKANANTGDSVIEVAECHGWVPGATLVIANGALQNEAQELRISSVERVSTFEDETESTNSFCIIHLASQLTQHVHAFIFKTGPPVRQEVMYLKRNIVITGRMYGLASEPRHRQGVVVRQHKTGTMQISHTRVEHCGRIFIGEYCLHFHLLNSSPSSFFRSNAVVDGISKGITVHGTHHSTVEDNVVYNVMGVGIYVENGKEMLNNFFANVVGCPTVEGCLCRGCVPSQSFGDESRQGAFYFKSAKQNFVDNHAFGALACFLIDYESFGSMFLPSGKMEGNVFHCKSFGWYPTNAFPRNVVQDANGIVDPTSCRAFKIDGSDNGVEVVIDNHTEYDIRDFGASSYEFSDIRFTNTRIQGRTALYQKTYWRSEGTGAFCYKCELIPHQFVGLNAAGGEALMEFRDTILSPGVFSIPHHGYVNGGLLASHYWFSGDVSKVSIDKIYDEGLSDPNAIIMTVGDVNHFMDRSRAAFDAAGIGCTNAFPDSPKAMTCPSGNGKFRPIKIYSDGPHDLEVTVTDPTSGAKQNYRFPHYNKKSSFVDIFAQQDGRIVYGGWAFTVRAGAEVSLKSMDKIWAIDFGHRGWDEPVSILLNLEVAGDEGGRIQGCTIRDDHVRRFMTPYGPLVQSGEVNGVGIHALCS
ncbi:hypothetical protein TrCOL_g12649 [Triparma columacea]|uniref:GH16 domain-containing protein n=1 Tax=Triparma columacea TaxID=722753 RepID=A0A9W7GGE4_9STRA|nr:hypothetical protein TrCOL_g12649 [Triparma columacea]